MPELSVTDDQLGRLEEVCDDLEGAFVADYGTVLPRDALEYLLDTYTPPAVDANGESAPETTNGTGNVEPGSDESDGETDDEDDDLDGEQSEDENSDDAEDADDEDADAEDAEVVGDGGSGGGGGSPAATLQQAMDLLDAHDDRWREGSGDEPYEVDLPDGSTEGARTKDDVKRLLFKHWR